ncbi:hypothetical protein EMPS_07000 [Entomortierella parvispora]|uniref:FAD-binding domain-containing protein n=1 Tax=Entomortierella parvispora TaxID=205924 RepID=A0A9P3HE22_9FUNG|nr:hypothetical protein EMPS_07000 [Entomortierella parvispora]
MLAILLDKARIPYEIYERTSGVKPLGSIMSLTANILAAIEQIGLLDELKAMSFPGNKVNIMYDNMEVAALFGNVDKDDEIGYEYFNFARPKFHELLLSKVPAEKIHYNKKVVSMDENEERVLIQCDDGTTYRGDILVGADGTYSEVRQSLYKTLQEKNLLPSSDAVEMKKGFLAMFGTTDPMDPEQYPFLKNEGSTFNQVIERGTSYSWAGFNIPENRVCWAVVSQIASTTKSEQTKFSSLGWGPESNHDFTDQVRDFKVPGCGTIGNLIDATPKDTICRVFLEEKLFKTWSFGRIVLIGDAAHKLLPSAGQGVVCALQDSVVLANCLYDLESLDKDAIHKTLLDFKEQRYHHVAELYEKIKINAVILHGQTLQERILRHVLLNWMPESIQRREIHKGFAYRPMVAFLPPIPKRGKIDLLPQKPSVRYEREQKKKREEEALKNKAAAEDGSSVTVSPIVAL